MSESYEGWAILELMGHRRLAGKVSEQEIAGAAMLRIDVFAGDDKKATATQFYSATAIYCLTPSTEELCRQFSQRVKPTPVQRYELPGPSSTTSSPPDCYEDREPDEDEVGDDDEL